MKNIKKEEVYKVAEIVFPTRAEIDPRVTRFIENLQFYGSMSVADYYLEINDGLKLFKIDVRPSDVDFGWLEEDIPSMVIVPVTGWTGKTAGYMLTLPAPRCFKTL